MNSFPQAGAPDCNHDGNLLPDAELLEAIAALGIARGTKVLVAGRGDASLMWPLLLQVKLLLLQVVVLSQPRSLAS